MPAPSFTTVPVPKSGVYSVAVRDALTEKHSPSDRSTPTASARGAYPFTVMPQFVEISARLFVMHQVDPSNVR